MIYIYRVYGLATAGMPLPSVAAIIENHISCTERPPLTPKQHCTAFQNEAVSPSRFNVLLRIGIHGVGLRLERVEKNVCVYVVIK